VEEIGLMKAIEYWDNRYNDFCNNVLGKEISSYEICMSFILNEISTIEEIYHEKTENNQCTPEQFILFCYINHELNLFDPLGCAYPSIWFEYTTYAWKMVNSRFENGGKQFQSKVKEQIETLVLSIGNHSNYTERTTCQRINKVVDKIYDRLFYIKKLHKEQFSERIFWEKQLKIFQYKVLGEYRKNYAANLTFLKEEQAHLIKHKDENMAKDYRDFVQFLYINHNLNLLDPIQMYYPQFHYQCEKNAWEILKAYKSSNAKEFPIKAEKIIVEIYEQEGIAWNRHQNSISYTITKIKEQLDEIKKGK
jgi:hypothetical protein